MFKAIALHIVATTTPVSISTDHGDHAHVGSAGIEYSLAVLKPESALSGPRR